MTETAITSPMTRRTAARRKIGLDGRRRRTLREPAEVGAAVDHAHLHLEDGRRLARRVVQRLRAVDGRAAEAVLYTVFEIRFAY